MAHRGRARNVGADDRPGGRQPGGFVADPGLKISPDAFGASAFGQLKAESDTIFAQQAKFARAERAAELAKVSGEAEAELNDSIQDFLDGSDASTNSVQQQYGAISKAMLKKHSANLSGTNRGQFETAFQKAIADGSITLRRDTRGKFVKGATATYNKMALADAQKAATYPDAQARKEFLEREGGAQDTLARYTENGIFDLENAGKRGASQANSPEPVPTPALPLDVR